MSLAGTMVSVDPQFNCMFAQIWSVISLGAIVSDADGFIVAELTPKHPPKLTEARI